MRNLVILKDSVLEFQKELNPIVSLKQDSRIVGICSHDDKEEILVLTNDGILMSYCLSSVGGDMTNKPWALNEFGNEGDKLWFSVVMVYESNSIICISHSGNIMSLQTVSSAAPESEGCVDDGIADASWSPDQLCLVIISNNNTILLMTNTFDVITEVPIEPRLEGSQSCISWRGDGMQFALYSVDACDGIARMRMYDRDLVLLWEGKTAAEGPGAVVKNLLPCLAYSPNGSIVAGVQQRTPKKQQVSE